MGSHRFKYGAGVGESVLLRFVTSVMVMAVVVDAVVRACSTATSILLAEDSWDSSSESDLTEGSRFIKGC